MSQQAGRAFLLGSGVASESSFQQVGETTDTGECSPDAESWHRVISIRRVVGCLVIFIGVRRVVGYLVIIVIVMVFDLDTYRGCLVLGMTVMYELEDNVGVSCLLTHDVYVVTVFIERDNSLVCSLSKTHAERVVVSVKLYPFTVAVLNDCTERDMVIFMNMR